ncbi:hypothetical protein FITA111629_07335 [Filibacter tadaridae]|uniref:Uncharacterized protein n=1 Tax=Filibacter tadaridae TaxID=2483811 RepID=A0A3P5XHE2_9BACL|nr:hypothetical protein [Filibacter tadaridae]VDC28121.1 hypothetical protein FILTAD_01742 [Filibacter tadaridae]
MEQQIKYDELASGAVKVMLEMGKYINSTEIDGKRSNRIRVK